MHFNLFPKLNFVPHGTSVAAVVKDSTVVFPAEQTNRLTETVASTENWWLARSLTVRMETCTRRLKELGHMLETKAGKASRGHGIAVDHCITIPRASRGISQHLEAS